MNIIWRHRITDEDRLDFVRNPTDDTLSADVFNKQVPPNVQSVADDFGVSGNGTLWVKSDGGKTL